MSAYRAALLALFVVGASVATLPASATGGTDDATPGASATGATADVASSGSAPDAPSRSTPESASRPTPDAPSRSTPDEESESPADAEEATGQSDPSGANDSSAANGTANDSAFGADISSFMQSSAAEVGGAIETGMWTAAYDDTDNRSVRVRLVERRTGDLREELTDLEQRKQELVAEREAGTVGGAAYKAKIGQLVGQINALRAAIDATEARAREVNANVAAIADLRTETENLSGPEIASVARNLTGVGNGVGEPGPPSGVGNGNGGGNGDGDAGPPSGVGNGNGSDAGPPDDVGNGDDGERGPPDNGTTVGAGGGDGVGDTPGIGNGNATDEKRTAAIA